MDLQQISQFCFRWAELIKPNTQLPFFTYIIGVERLRRQWCLRHHPHIPASVRTTEPCHIGSGCNCLSTFFRYHHNAFFMQWAGTTVRTANSAKFMNYTAAVFQNQDSKPDPDILIREAGWGGKNGGNGGNGGCLCKQSFILKIYTEWAL